MKNQFAIKVKDIKANLLCAELPPAVSPIAKEAAASFAI